MPRTFAQLDSSSFIKPEPKLLVKNLKIKGLLSFGPTGLDLRLGPLNVLIGPNGSGKSNLTEVFSLLRSAPRSLPAPVKEMGGVREWLWKGGRSASEAVINVVVSNPEGPQDIRHILRLREHGARFEVFDEAVENERPYAGKSEPFFYYRYQKGDPVLFDFQAAERRLRREQVLPEESILSQVKDPERYPALSRLQDAYNGIRLFRNWSFGPNAQLRREQSAQGRSDFLEDGGENLALVVSKLKLGSKAALLKSLRHLYAGLDDVDIVTDGGTVQLYLSEGDRSIPATRLSDGTLRYLCLLAILLHPTPPPLVVIEEPELGLHPDILPHIAELLVDCSERTQLLVTTHSRPLIDALSDQPESVIVCEKRDGETTMERLDPDRLKAWLGRYSLGELWSSGELGGNRW